MNLLNNVNNEPSNFWDYLIGFPGLVILLTLIGLIIGSYLSFDNDKKSGKMRKGIDDINAIVITTENKLKEASAKLESNIDIAKLNLDKVTLANVQLLETNEKLNKASLQLLDNYNKTLEALEASNKAKDEAINAQNETLKSKDEIIGLLTGGSSFPRISLKKGGFHISVQGEYSIPDLRIIIYALPNYLNIPAQVTSDYMKGKKTGPSYIFPIYSQQYYMVWAGHLPGSIDIPNFNEYLPTNDGIMNGFDIILETKHKKWKQQIRIVSHNGKWEIADKLLEIPTTQKGNVMRIPDEIFTEISENFPAIRTANTKTGKMMFYITYNAQAYDASKPSFDYIEYNHNNGAADREFDSL